MIRFNQFNKLTVTSSSDRIYRNPHSVLPTNIKIVKLAKSTFAPDAAKLNNCYIPFESIFSESIHFSPPSLLGMSSWDELLNFVKEENNVNPALPEHVTQHVTNPTQFNTDNLKIKLSDGKEFKIDRPSYLPVTFTRLDWAKNVSKESLFRSLGVALIPEEEKGTSTSDSAGDS